MKEVYVVSLDEEFDKAQVKGFTRTRRGKLERVNPYSRVAGEKESPQEHEVRRLDTMSEQALMTRATKITDPNKMINFFSMAKDRGMNDLAAVIKHEGRQRLGLKDSDFTSVDDIIKYPEIKSRAVIVVPDETEKLLEEAYTIFDSDEKEVKDIKNDLGGWLNDKNKVAQRIQDRDGYVSELNVPNKELAVIFGTELDGQISDGMWENDSRLGAHENWCKYTYAKIKIGDGPVLFTDAYKLPKVNFARVLTDRGLMGRMLWKVRNSVNPDYSARDLKRDIKRLNSYIIKEV